MLCLPSDVPHLYYGYVTVNKSAFFSMPFNPSSDTFAIHSLDDNIFGDKLFTSIGTDNETIAIYQPLLQSSAAAFPPLAVDVPCLAL